MITNNLDNQKSSNKIKITEEKFEEIESRYRILVDNMSEGLLQVDINDVIIFANTRFCEMSGYSFPEIIGKVGYLTLFDDTERNIIENKNKLRRKGVVDTYEIKMRCKDNSYKWVQIGGSPVTDFKGDIIGSIGVFTDISDRIRIEQELKESEKKYKDLFERSADALLIIKNGKFIDCNQATVNMLHYKNKNDLLNTHPSELSPEFQPDGRLSQEKAEEMMLLAVEKGSFRFEWNHKRADGEIFPVEVLLTAISAEEKHNIIYTVWRDITNRKNSELQLKRYAEELKALNEIKDKFFSIISHDLRGPFQGFLGVTALLGSEIETLSKDEIKELSEALNISLRKQFDLLNTLLEWARIQTGELFLKFEDINLKAKVDEVLQSFELLASQKRINLINQVENNISVFADQNTLSLVIRNLISNGIKFTNQSGYIKISALIKDKFVLVIFEDNGVGIPDDMVDKLFRIDVHYSTEGTSNESGTGLGLLLCKEIVHKFGGEIWVESVINKGSKFSISIPVKDLNIVTNG